ncbi:growth arrest-specific protein 1-like isoform X2 [Coccinella septempunctata]|nr:growth arrest-specific protein 1-like isoform X2 [Coccinella septempunctata]XP_044746679.1 growth arrest-specific protein 1-like isoform X2 [Coccinella septempunctata]
MWWIMLAVAAIVGGVDAMTCEEARMKCAYRFGCGRALQMYALDCSTVLQGPQPTHCPEVCQHSLLALLSTEEGENLMTCECSDEFCADQKRRTEVCKPMVMRQAKEPVLPCRVAQWICAADAQCSMALEYYNQLCRSMFHGKKCTSRCHNSISILTRQEKAAKLTNCRCDGTEEYDCRAIQKNMQKLCFRRHRRPHSGSKNESTPTVHHSVNNNNNHRDKPATKHRKTTTLAPRVVVVEEPNNSIRTRFDLFVLSMSFLLLLST